jgi:hypothetical protein
VIPAIKSSSEGRYLSEKGKAEFEAAYEDAMKFLPPPLETKDVETAFGRVRMSNISGGTKADDSDPIARLIESGMGKTHVPNIQIENWLGASYAINGEFPEEVNARILAFVHQHSDKKI